jgi:hypothetical protein
MIPIPIKRNVVTFNSEHRRVFKILISVKQENVKFKITKNIFAEMSDIKIF